MRNGVGLFEIDVDDCWMAVIVGKEEGVWVRVKEGVGGSFSAMESQKTPNVNPIEIRAVKIPKKTWRAFCILFLYHRLKKNR